MIGAGPGGRIGPGGFPGAGGNGGWSWLVADEAPAAGAAAPRVRPAEGAAARLGRPVAVVVDYGAGNLPSIVRALDVAGADVRVAASAAQLGRPDLVVLPGVGAQGPAMRHLGRSGLARAIDRAVGGGAWYLGICLGLQLLFERSDEDGSRGLGWLAGESRLLPSAPVLPHVGWNAVEPVAPHRLLDGLPAGAPMYFVHSYAPVPTDRAAVLAETEHGGRFASAVGAGRLLGVQFHPEKSGRDGLRVLSNVLAMVGEAAAVGSPEA